MRSKLNPVSLSFKLLIHIFFAFLTVELGSESFFAILLLVLDRNDKILTLQKAKEVTF